MFPWTILAHSRVVVDEEQSRNNAFKGQHARKLKSYDGDIVGVETGKLDLLLFDSTQGKRE